MKLALPSSMLNNAVRFLVLVGVVHSSFALAYQRSATPTYDPNQYRREQRAANEAGKLARCEGQLGVVKRALQTLMTSRGLYLEALSDIEKVYLELGTLFVPAEPGELPAETARHRIARGREIVRLASGALEGANHDPALSVNERERVLRPLLLLPINPNAERLAGEHDWLAAKEYVTAHLPELFENNEAFYWVVQVWNLRPTLQRAERDTTMAQVQLNAQANAYRGMACGELDLAALERSLR